MTGNVGQARPPPARMRAGYASFISTGREKKSQQEVSMKHYVKSLVAVLFLVFVIPAYAGPSPLTLNYPGAPFAVPFAAGTPMTAGVYTPTVNYMVGGNPWVNATNPVTPTYLNGISAADFSILTAAFPGSAGYKYQSSTLAPNSLSVQTYAALGSATSVGCDFYVTYTPNGNDPTTNVHWIQIIDDNYNITNNPGYGNKENRVDNPYSPGGRSPYYDDGGAATSTAFYDVPTRNNPGQKDTWMADLYLVSGPAAGTPGNIIIYGGIQWGWNNYPKNGAPAPIPLPSALLLFAPALAGIGVFRRRFKN